MTQEQPRNGGHNGDPGPSKQPVRDYRSPRCPRCNVTWRQRGNRTGHCSACHRTFDTLSAFESHRVGHGNDRGCLPVELLAKYESRVGDGPFDEGTVYWREVPDESWSKSWGK